jgi:hypothetical protein
VHPADHEVDEYLYFYMWKFINFYKIMFTMYGDKIRGEYGDIIIRESIKGWYLSK